MLQSRPTPDTRYVTVSPDTWSLIRGAYLSGLSARTVAGRFGVSEGALRKRAARGLDQARLRRPRHALARGARTARGGGLPLVVIPEPSVATTPEPSGAREREPVGSAVGKQGA